MQQSLPSGVIAGIVVVVVALLGAVGYKVFLAPQDTASRSHPDNQAYQSMQQKARTDPEFMQKMQAKYSHPSAGSGHGYPGYPGGYMGYTGGR